MLDKAFETLKTYDWGQDRNLLNPIDEAIVATHGDDAKRKELEDKLAAVLKTDVTYDAKQFVCRKLMVIGTASSVPTLAELLADEKLSHMARYALERIPCEEANKALLDAMGKTEGELKVGMISSLGVRSDAASVAPLAALLGDSDSSVAGAAAVALGVIGSSEAGKALADAKPSAIVSDASLACAESLLADGKKLEALTTYKRILKSKPPKHVKVAATRGMLACAKKK